MGFTKLDEGILRSSIMAESAEVFKVWIAFLAACGPDGIARTSSVFISSVCRLDHSVVQKAIARLEAPDPESRTETEEGRRIRKVDGGWFIINYRKHRVFQYSEEPDAVRKRKYRKRMKRDISGTCPGYSASASISSSSLQGNKKDKDPKIILILDEDPKRWEGITDELKKFWAEAYKGVDIEATLREMVAYWDAQPRSQLKLNWKRAIVNRLKWLQDHQAGRRLPARGNAPGTFMRTIKERGENK